MAIFIQATTFSLATARAAKLLVSSILVDSSRLFPAYSGRIQAELVLAVVVGDYQECRQGEGEGGAAVVETAKKRLGDLVLLSFVVVELMEEKTDDPNLPVLKY
jgi:hypothetical protein